MNKLGDYKLRRRLAVGGMGEVYLGEKIGPEGFVKPVVLKCVLPQLSRDQAFVQLFLDEARVAALLNHPNIAQVYDFGEADGVYYMAMEYVPGYTIDDIRRKHEKIGKKMPIEHVACIASQAAQGLEYAHALCDARGVSLGLVHRDVSPHNVMVSVDGGVKIVDFGIAKARAGLTRVEATGAVGKFGYMSPEQARGESVDGRTDVFSLGICVWELVTSQRLYDSNLEQPPNYDPSRPILSVASFREDIPKQFERVIHSALEIDASKRFSSCKQMHLELERFMAARTHYAGHAALAEYIRQLVAGDFDSPTPKRVSGGLVEPVGANEEASLVSGGAETSDSDALAGVQKYEEVFGIEPSLGEQEPTKLPKVPETWKARAPKSPPAPASKPQARQQKTPNPKKPERRKHPMSDGPDLELDVVKEPPRKVPAGSANRKSAKPQMAERAPRQRGLSGTALAGLFLIVLGLGFATWHYREIVMVQINELSGGNEKVEMSTRFRIITEPSGGEVFIDGKRAGIAPVIVEFLPEVAQYVEIRKKGYSTHRAVISPEVVKGLRVLDVKLGPKGRLLVQSKPSGGAVILNGVPIPKLKTPVTLTDVPANIPLQVTVEKSGLAPVTLSTKLSKDGSKTLFFNLKGQ